MSGEDEPQAPGQKESPLCLFLGAGASVSAGVPATVQFVDEIERGLKGNEESLKLFLAIKNALQERLVASGQAGQKIDLELILESISLLQSPPLSVDSLYASKELGVPCDQPRLSRLEETIRKIVREKCIVDEVKTDYFRPLARLYQAYGLLNIFTTNYDVVLDQFALRTAARFVDGFQLRWDPSLFQVPTTAHAFIYRLHGSVTWYRSTAFGFLELPVREGSEELVFLSGEKAEALLLYPAQKDLLYSPFVYCLNALHTKLHSSPWWLVVGYTFRDEQLLGAFQEAAAQNQDLRLIVVSPEADQIFEQRLERRSQDGSPSPLERKANPTRVLRLPYRFESSFNDIVSTIFPQFSDTVTLDSQFRLNEIWGAQTDWPKVALGYATIGLLDPLRDLETEKLAGKRLAPDWVIRYNGAKALHELAHNDAERAKADWNELSRALEALRSIRPRLDAFGNPPMQFRPAFGYQGKEVVGNPPARTVTYGYSPDNVAAALEDVQKVADRIRRCSASESVSFTASKIATNLGSLVEYLKMFAMNGMNGFDYVELRRRNPSPEIDELGRLIRPEMGPLDTPRLERIKALFESVESPLLDKVFADAETWPG